MRIDAGISIQKLWMEFGKQTRVNLPPCDMFELQKDDAPFNGPWLNGPYEFTWKRPQRVEKTKALL
jgi:hypothetical protein